MHWTKKQPHGGCNTKSSTDTVPPPSAKDSLKLILEPLGGTFLGNVYSDGSRLDGPSQLLARNGWTFVVVDCDGILIAAASGAPPDSVEDIPATEAWALTQAAMRAELGCVFFIGCEPCVHAFHGGVAAACADNKPLAGVHRLMLATMDDVPTEAVLWTPSHGKKGGCGATVRGWVPPHRDGRRVQ